MKLEEYILKRKKEDGINEYDFEKRPENIRICVNYIFEYFNNYINTKPFDEKTILHDRKIDYYRKSISCYDTEVKEWLVSMYSSYGKYLHKQLMNYITDDYFLLYNTEAEFRALSYNIYPNVIKRLKFLEGQSEMIYQFIKEAHRIRNIYDSDIYISENINEWIEETHKKYGVNIYSFCYEYTESYFETPEKWPIGHKIKGPSYDKRNDPLYRNSCLIWDYDVRQKNNLFGLDTLYRNMPKKDFIKGRKQEFEAVLMYCWLHYFADDKDNYWDEYSRIVLV